MDPPNNKRILAGEGNIDPSSTRPNVFVVQKARRSQAYLSALSALRAGVDVGINSMLPTESSAPTPRYPLVLQTGIPLATLGQSPFPFGRFMNLTDSIYREYSNFFHDALTHLPQKTRPPTFRRLDQALFASGRHYVRRSQ